MTACKVSSGLRARDKGAIENKVSERMNKNMALSVHLLVAASFKKKNASLNLRATPVQEKMYAWKARKM